MKRSSVPDRVDFVGADSVVDQWPIPGAATVPAPSAVLIRPDGYVAWVATGEPDRSALRGALETWCGPAKAE